MLYLNEELLTADEFVKWLEENVKDENGMSVNIPRINGKEIKEFQYMPFRMKYDAFGQLIKPLRTIPRNYTVTTPNGIHLDIRYATAPPVNDQKTGARVFRHAKELFGNNGVEKRKCTARDYELFLFLYLSPECSNSPFGDPNKYYWELLDRQKSADERKVVNKGFAQVLHEIYNLEEGAIRQKASGLGVSQAHELILEEVQNILAEKARVEGISFVNKWNDKQTSFKGKVLSAVELGLIKTDGKVWRFKDGTDIAHVRQKENPVDTLFNEFVDNFDVFNDKLNTLIKGENLEKKLANIDSKITSKMEDKVNLLIAEEVIVFDTSDETVYLVTKKGKEELCKKETKWKKDLLELLEKDANLATKITNIHKGYAKMAV